MQLLHHLSIGSQTITGIGSAELEHQNEQMLTHELISVPWSDSLGAYTYIEIKIDGPSNFGYTGLSGELGPSHHKAILIPSIAIKNAQKTFR